jgi:hypothetical protein
MVSLIWGASFDFEREILFISGRSGIYSLDINEAKEI